MESIKKFRAIFIFLTVSLIFAMTIGGIFFAQQDIGTMILWYLYVVCFIAIPMIGVFFTVAEYQDGVRAAIKKTAMEIDVFSEDSGEKISQTNEFDNIGKSVDKLYKDLKEKDDVERKLNQFLVITATNLGLDDFFDKSIDLILDITQSNLVAIYVVDKVTGKLEIKSSRGFSSEIFTQFDINIGEGFVGQAAARNETKIVRDLPDDTVYIAQNFLGKMKPKSILVVPVSDEDNEVIAVMALGSFFDYDGKTAKIAERVGKYISYAIRNGLHYEKNLRLTSELKFQGQLMQNLNDDLEDKIKERTVFLNNIINSISDTAIITVDKDNYITIINQGAERLFNIDSEKVRGKNINIIANADTETEKILNENIYEAVTNGRANYKCLFSIRDNIKTEVSMELFCLYNEFGDKNGVTIVIRDMSEMNKIKSQSQNDKMLTEILISESPTALVVTDGNGMITQINRNAKYILNINGDFKSSKNIADFFENRASVKGFIADAVKNRTNASFKESLVSGINVKFEINVISSGMGDDAGDDVRLLIYIH